MDLAVLWCVLDCMVWSAVGMHLVMLLHVLVSGLPLPSVCEHVGVCCVVSGVGCWCLSVVWLLGPVM